MQASAYIAMGSAAAEDVQSPGREVFLFLLFMIPR